MLDINVQTSCLNSHNWTHNWINLIWRILICCIKNFFQLIVLLFSKRDILLYAQKEYNNGNGVLTERYFNNLRTFEKIWQQSGCNVTLVIPFSYIFLPVFLLKIFFFGVFKRFMIWHAQACLFVKRIYVLLFLISLWRVEKSLPRIFVLVTLKATRRDATPSVHGHVQKQRLFAYCSKCNLLLYRRRSKHRP